MAGATAIDTRAGGPTVNTVEPVTLWRAAPITLVPGLTLEAKPPAVMVATLVVAEVQVTLAVRFCVVPSE